MALQRILLATVFIGFLFSFAASTYCQAIDPSCKCPEDAPDGDVFEKQTIVTCSYSNPYISAACGKDESTKICFPNGRGGTICAPNPNFGKYFISCIVSCQDTKATPNDAFNACQIKSSSEVDPFNEPISCDQCGTPSKSGPPLKVGLSDSSSCLNEVRNYDAACKSNPDMLGFCAKQSKTYKDSVCCVLKYKDNVQTLY